MIQLLEIKNFKSVHSLKLKCKRVNIFIGEPNTGKSNILEALALLGQSVVQEGNFSEIIRLKSTADLFFDSNINQAIEIKTDDLNVEIKYAYSEKGAVLNQFHLSFINTKDNKVIQLNQLSLRGEIIGFTGENFNTKVRYYQYKRLKSFQNSLMPHLSPPFGENLPVVLLSNPDIRKWVSETFKSYGYKLQLKPVETDINISKEVDDELYSYPYYSISETLQRIVFIYTAMESNKDTSLIFDEPESNTFPFYTKFIAERIGRDLSNQYFVTTHNPYLLLNTIQNTDIKDLQVCITKMEDYKTKVYPLSQKQIEKVLEYDVDVFLNLDRIIKA